MVPGEGIEPPHPCEYEILSLARLPVPPSGLRFNQRSRFALFAIVSLNISLDRVVGQMRAPSRPANAVSALNSVAFESASRNYRCE